VLRRKAVPASQVRILLPPPRSGVVESVRRATVNCEAQVRTLPPELQSDARAKPARPRKRGAASGASGEGQVRALPPEPAPVVERDDAGFSTRKVRVRVPPGVLRHLAVGETAPRRLREPEAAGSTPASQTCAVEERLSSRAS
jgi:hypothetical protein